jgi:3-hydroxybutyryl-CoA dehydrogenase
MDGDMTGPARGPMRLDELRTAAIAGAGTMGACIAGLLARAGLRVFLLDRTEEILSRGIAAMRASHDSLVDAGRLTPEDAREAQRRVTAVTTLEAACVDADFFLEALPEDAAIKKDLLARADALCPPRAVFVSNTSGLSITDLASATRRPECFAGMHFFNPPHVIPLVEVVRGERTSDPTAAFLLAAARAWGKRPVLVKREVPGFLANRLQFAVFREALHMLEQGYASAEDIDTAMTAGPGLRWGLLGPLRIADLGGLDIFHVISGYLFGELSADSRPSGLLGKLVADGRTGAKTGGGFYDYRQGEAAQISARRDRVLLAFLEAIESESPRGTEGPATEEETHG